MKACISLAAAISVILMGGCQRSGFNMERYKNAVKDGFTKIPQACEIENLLGEADHFISYSGPDVRQDWNTEVYFAGRTASRCRWKLRLTGTSVESSR